MPEGERAFHFFHLIRVVTDIFMQKQIGYYVGV